jgi:hypothetical protein
MAGGVSRDRQENDGKWSAREIARRNRESVGKPLSPVMKTAATARELAHGRAAQAAGKPGKPHSS